ncbi:hypothetical protein Sjap_022755 [Stephania japonica]|uniref:RING-type domain-containing protein n=1 Tax=Stephania japonica TaxID=461633 RepID=A0AAP0HQ61_9MAGN
MYRYRSTTLTHPTTSPRQGSCPRLLVPLALWMCVSVLIRYGYYGNSSVVLGPSASCLLQTSTVFVEGIQVRDRSKRGLVLYGFTEAPQLRSESSYSNVSKFLLVGTYRRKHFSLWLNRGSRIVLDWTVNIRDFDHLFVYLTKGHVKLQQSDFITKSTYSQIFGNPSRVTGRAEFLIKEDGSYHVCILNMNLRSIALSMNISAALRVYDTSNATSKCSAVNGSCQLNLAFPKPQFLILTTPTHFHGDLNDWWCVEMSFVARLLVYMVLLGIIVGIVFCILKLLGTCDYDHRGEANDREDQTRVSERDPLMQPANDREDQMRVSERDPLMQPGKTSGFNYGTSEEDDGESGLHSISSEDLYDGKICAICYDKQRNCFFVPCGHCATCFECAKRIMDEEGKVCPICRRFIHKTRRLFSA